MASPTRLAVEQVRRLRFQNGQGAQNDVAERVVMKAMTKLIEAGGSPTDARNAGDYLPAQIVAKGFSEGYSKKELASAMNRLMGAGRLKREVVGKYPNRAPRYGLAAVTR